MYERENPMAEDLLLDIHDGIATLTLNRPKQRNALNYGMFVALRDICPELETNPAIRVVIITGAGTDAFSAGGDIKEFDERRSNSAQAREYSEVLNAALHGIAGLSKPTISLIKGYCIGGGCELACFTDIRIATPASQFGITPARLSIALGYKEIRRIAQLVGPGNLSYLLLSARLVDAADALQMGLVNKVIPPEEIDEYTTKLASEMAALAPVSHRANKTIINTVLNNPELENLTKEQEALPFQTFDSEDFKEGRRAFVEKRPPKFNGS
ncbi:MAG: enoyl-CoA hydratase [SAR202 cluster bacterium]|nr:enoyl-CoA hydratase [SAR202 cluster bacterium]|tara:strand:- start:1630 stop:2439 length:810 start_codon:yes stop_codon:yes gene_type:complete